MNSVRESKDELYQFIKVIDWELMKGGEEVSSRWSKYFDNLNLGRGELGNERKSEVSCISEERG